MVLCPCIYTIVNPDPDPEPEPEPLVGLFVDPVGGDDTGAGTEEDPWQTLDNIFSYYVNGAKPPGWIGVSPGDTIYLLEGTLSGTTNIGTDSGASFNPEGGPAGLYIRNQDGTALNPITLTVHPDNTGPVIFDVTGDGAGIWIHQTSYWNIDGGDTGIIIENAFQSGLKLTECDHFNVTNVLIRNTDGIQNNNLQGLHILTSTDINVTDCTFHDNYDRTNNTTENSSNVAIFSSGNLVFTNCHSYQTPLISALHTGAGIKIKHGSSDPTHTLVFTGCLFENHAHYAFGCGGSNLTFDHNVIDGGYGVMLKDFGGPTHQVNHEYAYNTLYDVKLPFNWANVVAVSPTAPATIFATEPDNIEWHHNLIVEALETHDTENATIVIDTYETSSPMYTACLAAMDFHDNRYSNVNIVPSFSIMASNTGGRNPEGGVYVLATWQALGAQFDLNSTIANPTFVNAGAGDFNQTGGSATLGYGAM